MSLPCRSIGSRKDTTRSFHPSTKTCSQSLRAQPSFPWIPNAKRPSECLFPDSRECRTLTGYGLGLTRAGRYDSTDRHCKGCNGFSEVFSNIPASPLEVTIGEFKSIQAFRNNPESGKTDDETPALVEAAVVKMVKMVMEGTGSDLEDIIFPPDLASEPQHPPAIAGHLDKDEQRSPSPSPSPIQRPQTPQDAVESDPPSDFVETYHTTGDDPDQITPAGVVQYYNAPLNAPWDKWDIAWPLGM
jgi:hypothetical protein